MPPIIAIGLLIVVTTVVVYIQGKPDHMDEKRTYIFEDADGERYNPFSDMTEGVEEKSEKEWKYEIDDF